MFTDKFEDILACEPVSNGEIIGSSREGRDIEAYKFGQGSCQISLLGGCHADEPIGPRFLRHLVAFLSTEPRELLENFTWWIVPHINPDGELVNNKWYDPSQKLIDLDSYKEHVVRELPGDDIEFGFPRNVNDKEARPENIAAYNWWKKNTEPFNLHVSMHGMAYALGPWFLIEPAWVERTELLRTRCKHAVAELGYELHDVERHGEKGFNRIEKGFCTRPNSRCMSLYFLERNDDEMASKFRPSSMETIRNFGGDPLTLVTEMPLFIGEDKENVTPMPVLDQMRLQWTYICAGIEQGLSSST